MKVEVALQPFGVFIVLLSVRTMGGLGLLLGGEGGREGGRASRRSSGGGGGGGGREGGRGGGAVAVLPGEGALVVHAGGEEGWVLGEGGREGGREGGKDGGRVN